MQALRRYWYLFTLLFGLLGFILGGWGWIASIHMVPLKASPKNEIYQQNVTSPVATERKISSGLRLIIPSIGVDAPIEAVGIAADGTMDVPQQNQWDGVGWYKYGPYPGETGSAVVAGHADQPSGSPAVFARLHDMHIGETVLVNNDTGDSLRFRVIDVQIYAVGQAPKKTIFGNHTGKFLNLITCAGEWIPEEDQTSQRFVVYTEMM